MSKVKLQSLLKENKGYPINGYTSKSYQSQNHHNLNESFEKNGFEYNIWLSEKQCERMKIKLIDKSNPSHTVGKNGEEFKIYNISQTDFIKPKRKKSVSNPKVVNPTPTKPSTSSKDIRIEMLEKMVIHLYDKLGYSMEDVDLKGYFEEEETPQPQYTTNQTQLSKRLKLPSNVITHLRDTKTIIWKKMGRSILFEETSIQQFEKTFNRDDYLTVSECKNIMDRWGFYSNYEKGVYVNKLYFYIVVKTLINGSDDIPSEYTLDVKQFGTTKYISRKSLSKTLRWLNNLYKKNNPKFTKQQTEILKKQLDEKKNKKPHPFQKRKLKFRKSV